MKLKAIATLASIIATVLLSGCATNADVSQMIADHNPAVKLTNKNFQGQFQLRQVTGGHETNPLWTSQINNENFKQALITSLELANLYGGFDRTKYQIDAHLVKLSQPLIGLNLTVGCEVNYKVQNVKTNHLIFDQNIFTSYTKKFEDDIDPADRMKKANEGAARANIKAFIQQLYGLKAN